MPLQEPRVWTSQPRSVSSGSVGVLPPADLGEKVPASSSMPQMNMLSIKPEPPTPLIPDSLILERPTFAIDKANEDDEDAMYAIGGDDDVMDEVDAFLEAHDSGLTEAQKAEAQGRFDVTWGIASF